MNNITCADSNVLELLQQGHC